MVGIARPIFVGTVVAGTLDLSAAFMSAWAVRARAPDAVLRGVAAGPFGDVMRDGGPLAAMAGLVVHYGIMAAMVAVFVIAARAAPALLRHPVTMGLAYGALTYLIMNWIVLPLRWPEVFPTGRPLDIVLAFLFHTLLVGVPIAVVTAHYRLRRG